MENKILLQTDENKIELNTGDNSFYVYEKKKEQSYYDDEGILDKFPTYQQAQDFLDRRLDKKKKGLLKKKEPLNAIGQISSYYADNKDFQKVKITSINPTSYSVECWISDGKNRSKKGISYLLKDTEKNWEILRQEKELKQKLTELEEQKERFTQDELKEYFKNE